MQEIIGNKFGRWTVIRYIGKTNSRDKLYECKCDCGTVRNIAERSLKRGNSKSCGCLKKDLLKQKTGDKHHNFKDIAGQRFGRLVVVGDSGQRQCGLILWECRCDCGNTTYVPSSSLKSGRTKSCGCYQKSGDPYRHIPGVHEKLGFNDLTGKRFGRLVVKQLANGRAQDCGFLWECKCDCGEETIVEQRFLQKGVTQSCGCLREERRLEALKKPEFAEKQRKNSTDKWPEAAEKIGMQDNTNVSIIKSKKARCDSSTGVRGVMQKRKGYYVAHLTFQKKKYMEYGFKSVEEAAKARDRMYAEIVLPYLESVGRA